MYSGKCADQLYCTCQGRPMKVPHPRSLTTPINYISFSQLTGAVEYHEHFMFDLLGSPMVVRGDAFTLPDDLRIPYPCTQCITGCGVIMLYIHIYVVMILVHVVNLYVFVLFCSYRS